MTMMKDYGISKATVYRDLKEEPIPVSTKSTEAT